MGTATFDGLDISNPTDRDAFRGRVAQEYDSKSLSSTITEARRLGGKCRTALEAVRIIADDRIERERLKDFPYHLFGKTCLCGSSHQLSTAEIMSGEYVLTCRCGFNDVKRV